MTIQVVEIRFDRILDQNSIPVASNFIDTTKQNVFIDPQEIFDEMQHFEVLQILIFAGKGENKKLPKAYWEWAKQNGELFLGTTETENGYQRIFITKTSKEGDVVEIITHPQIEEQLAATG